MNGYQMQAESLRRYLKENPSGTLESKEAMERQIRGLEFLGSCSERDIRVLYDSGAFNGITKVYAKKAMEKVGLSEEQIKDVLDELGQLHDTVGAENI